MPCGVAPGCEGLGPATEEKRCPSSPARGSEDRSRGNGSRRVLLPWLRCRRGGGDHRQAGPAHRGRQGVALGVPLLPSRLLAARLHAQERQRLGRAAPDRGRPDSPVNAGLLEGRAGRVWDVVGAAVFLFIAAYTGVLLAVSNQPIWSGTWALGGLFLASGLSGAAALLLLLARRRPAAEASRGFLELCERLFAALWTWPSTCPGSPSGSLRWPGCCRASARSAPVGSE
jgi:hypothetical protein